MGYFKDLTTKPMYCPYEQLSAINNKYITQAEYNLILKRSTGLFSKYEYKLKDTNRKEYFKNVCKMNKRVIYSPEEEPLCNFTTSDRDEVVIYDGKKGNRAIVNISKKPTPEGIHCKSFYISYTNLINNQPRAFDMNCDKKFCACGIFYGEEHLGAPMVCRITQIPRTERFKFEIAPGVDMALMYVLGLVFIQKAKNYRFNRRNKAMSGRHSSKHHSGKHHSSKHHGAGMAGMAGVGAAGLAGGLATGMALNSIHHHHHYGFGNGYYGTSLYPDNGSYSSSSSASSFSQGSYSNDDDYADYGDFGYGAYESGFGGYDGYDGGYDGGFGGYDGGYDGGFDCGGGDCGGD